jgi:hypothetical protein
MQPLCFSVLVYFVSLYLRAKFCAKKLKNNLKIYCLIPELFNLNRDFPLFKIYHLPYKL